MAYIRNKNGIFKLIEQKGDICFVTIDGKHFFYEKMDTKANTIQELCEDFIVEKVFDGKPDIHRFSTLKDAVNYARRYEPVYAGFWIWGEGFLYRAVYDEDKNDLVLISRERKEG